MPPELFWSNFGLILSNSRTKQELISAREEGMWCSLFWDLLLRVSGVLLGLPHNCLCHCQVWNREGIGNQESMAPCPDLNFIYINTDDVDCFYFISLQGYLLCLKLGFSRWHSPAVHAASRHFPRGVASLFISIALLWDRGWGGVKWVLLP